MNWEQEAEGPVLPSRALTGMTTTGHRGPEAGRARSPPKETGTQESTTNARPRGSSTLEMQPEISRSPQEAL